LKNEKKGGEAQKRKHGSPVMIEKSHGDVKGLWINAMVALYSSD